MFAGLRHAKELVYILVDIVSRYKQVHLAYCGCCTSTHHDGVANVYLRVFQS